MNIDREIDYLRYVLTLLQSNDHKIGLSTLDHITQALEDACVLAESLDYSLSSLGRRDIRFDNAENIAYNVVEAIRSYGYRFSNVNAENTFYTLLEHSFMRIYLTTLWEGNAE